MSISQSTPHVQIRPVTQDDKQSWLSLWQGYNDFYKRTVPSDVTGFTFSRFLDPAVKMFCAVAEEAVADSKDEHARVIGFITWYPHMSTSATKDVVYIHDLFVDPSVRSRGTGRKLIEYVYDKAENELDAASVYWHTQHFNHVGQILYTKVASWTPFVKYEKKF